jgi:hypothetical protein
LSLPLLPLPLPFLLPTCLVAVAISHIIAVTIAIALIAVALIAIALIAVARPPPLSPLP